MACKHVSLPTGGSAIICGLPKPKRCVACGKPSDLLCDWKVKRRKSGTCDRPICDACTYSPAEGKDLCPEHAAEWRNL